MSSRLIKILFIIISIPVIGFILNLIFYFGILVGSYIRYVFS